MIDGGMDGFALIASLVQSLAWPVAVVSVVFMFRHALGKVIPALRSLKFKDVEVQFGEQIAVAKQELEPAGAKGISAPAPATAPETKRSSQYYRTLAEISPRAAILEAWLGFELVAGDAAEALAPVAARSRPLQMPKLFNLLAEAGLLTSAEVDALTRLRALRNQVVHGPEPNVPVPQIEEFASILERITDSLQERLKAR